MSEHALIPLGRRFRLFDWGHVHRIVRYVEQPDPRNPGETVTHYLVENEGNGWRWLGSDAFIRSTGTPLR
ncbi:hypothetical protein [Amycolatopsis sp. CA-230715]|uniref:hypothetical protein n=1 Tax=Amycolatopsis sp. CA-230715 TaxID=2745196 RepID=UPI001C031D37|nr:hypothetical protein [Amycolatopsis sp. CA-230715]QWF81144.1 hypothetical protein HUW46_04570 [Amycolatopsis sp. CA-230715]